MEKDRAELFQEFFNDPEKIKQPFTHIIFKSREELMRFREDRYRLANGYGMGESQLPIDNSLRVTPSTMGITWFLYDYRPVTSEEARQVIREANRRIPWDWHTKYFETPYR